MIEFILSMVTSLTVTYFIKNNPKVCQGCTSPYKHLYFDDVAKIILMKCFDNMELNLSLFPTKNSVLITKFKLFGFTTCTRIGKESFPSNKLVSSKAVFLNNQSRCLILNDFFSYYTTSAHLPSFIIFIAFYEIA